MLTELNYPGLKQALTDDVPVDANLRAAILHACDKTEDDLRSDLINEFERPVIVGSQRSESPES